VSISFFLPSFLRLMGWVVRILKSIWYRMNNFTNSKRTRLSKVSPTPPQINYTHSSPGLLHMGNPGLWHRRVVPLPPSRNRRTRHSKPNRDHHLPNRQTQRRRAELYLHARCRCREGCDHFVAFANAFWETELG
jgi:hypothetical protein